MEPDDLLASEKLERLQRRQRRRRRSSGNSPDFEDLNDEDEGALDAEAEAQADAQTSESRVRPRRQAPYVIYPEVLVIVDYDGYRLHGGDNLQVRNWDWFIEGIAKKKTYSAQDLKLKVVSFRFRSPNRRERVRDMHNNWPRRGRIV